MSSDVTDNYGPRRSTRHVAVAHCRIAASEYHQLVGYLLSDYLYKYYRTWRGYVSKYVSCVAKYPLGITSSGEDVYTFRSSQNQQFTIVALPLFPLVKIEAFTLPVFGRPRVRPLVNGTPGTCAYATRSINLVRFIEFIRPNSGNKHTSLFSSRGQSGHLRRDRSVNRRLCHSSCGAFDQ